MRAHIALALMWLVYSIMCAFAPPVVGGAFMVGINVAAYWDSRYSDA